MTTTEEKLSNQEIGRRGDEIYERVIRSQVEPEKNEQILVIDVLTEDWEVDPDEITAAHRLSERRPQGQIWTMRVGSRHLAHFGTGRSRKSI